MTLPETEGVSSLKMNVPFITLHIPGLPVSKMRHRSATGKRSYSPQSAIERSVQWEIRAQVGTGFQMTEKPLRMTVEAFFPRPKRHYGTGRNADVLKESSPQFHTNKPDHDNIIKFYLDCMNKLVFLDDTQVVRFGECGKNWVDKNEPGHVEIRIWEL